MLRSFRERSGDGLRGLSRSDVDRLQLAIGRLSAMTVRDRTPSDLRDVEFRIYSQFGEDGIIAYLTGVVPIENDTFVEIGVEDYTECNTRLLLCNDNWRGLIIDGGSEHVRTIEETGLRWRHTVDAISAWVTRENVNALIASGGIAGDIGLLSIDIDGNDYWVLEVIEVVSPRIVVAEYNSAFGPEAAVSVPYEPRFNRAKAHPSCLYYGASLPALCLLMSSNGYRLVGSNSAGNNAFFVRNDVAGDLPDLGAAQAHVVSRFREGRDAGGSLTYRSASEGLASLAALPLVDVAAGSMSTVGELLGFGP